MNARSILGLMLVCSMYLIRPSDALACVCLGGIATFESQVADAPLVVAARVVAVEPLKNSAGEVTTHVAAIRVDVLDVLRGGKNRKEFRVWDQFAGSSCSLELIELPVGTLLIIALDPRQERLRAVWDLTGIRPGPLDYVFGTCQQNWRIFKTESELRRYVSEHTKSRL